MKAHLRSIALGAGSVFNVYPCGVDMPPELQRFMNQPKTVEEGILADTNAMRQDWDRVGSSLRQAVSGINHVGPHR